MATVPRRTKTTRAQKREDTQARLSAAVERLLAEGDLSYTELSVERLVTEAGISRSTFYVYFEDKGDLLASLASDVIHGLIDAANVWWAMGPEPTREDLREAMAGITDVYVAHRVVMAAVVGTASHDPRVREQFGGLVAETIDKLAEHIRAGQEAGFVRAGLDPDDTAAWLTWMSERGLYQFVAPAEPEVRERLVASLTDIVWNVLYAR